MKDKTEKMENYDVVYKIECANNLCDAAYIGQTGRYLKTRIKEHEININKALKITTDNLTVSNEQPQRRDKRRRHMIPRSPDRNASSAAITTHAKNFKHLFKLKEVKILHKEKKLNKRLILESVEILKNRNACNTRSDVDGINDSYKDLIQLNKIK